MDPNVLSALIGAVAAVVVALITTILPARAARRAKQETLVAAAEVRKLAANLASAAIILAHKSEGFVVIHDAGVRRKDKTLDYAHNILKGIDIDMAEIADALDIDYLGTASDYLTFLENSIGHSSAKDKRFQEVVKPRREFSSANELPQPTKIKDTLQELDLINDNTIKIVDDYEYFIKHQQHRDPLRWRRRASW